MNNDEYEAAIAATRAYEAQQRQELVAKLTQLWDEYKNLPGCKEMAGEVQDIVDPPDQRTRRRLAEMTARAVAEVPSNRRVA
jgi:hypothetical protein